VVARPILESSEHCKGGADIEVNVCATPTRKAEIRSQKSEDKSEKAEEEARGQT